ncbi:MAG: hypothetical protein V1837_00945 [Candidatus Woesearchaeota archaeon]
MVFPRAKRNISSFLLSEEGKISKQSLIAVGSVLSAFAVASALAASQAAAHSNACTHTNGLSFSFSNSGLKAMHNHSITLANPNKDPSC